MKTPPRSGAQRPDVAVTCLQQRGEAGVVLAMHVCDVMQRCLGDQVAMDDEEVALRACVGGWTGEARTQDFETNVAAAIRVQYVAAHVSITAP